MGELRNIGSPVGTRETGSSHWLAVSRLSRYATAVSRLIFKTALTHLLLLAVQVLNAYRVSRFSKETSIACLAALGLFTHLALRYLGHVEPHVANWPLLVVLIAGGAPLLFDIVRHLFTGDLGADLLAGLSILVSAILGEYLAGVIIILMLSSGTVLEQYAARRASDVLAALAKRMPRIAHRSTNQHIEEINLDAVQVGDHLVVLPHEICPVDGVVGEGQGTMDESYLTGEPFQIRKGPGAEVFSGAVNGETALNIIVKSLPIDSRYSKIMRVMQEAENNKPHIRRLADRLGAWYTLLALAVAAAGYWNSGEASRFLAVLVIATPCPLLLAIPITIMGAISAAAKRSIIIKNPGMLEIIDSCRTVIFDKTGTLTFGKPSLTRILCAPGINENEAIQLAASLEQYSKHPLSASILTAATDRNLALLPALDIGERPGAGLTGLVSGARIQITSRKQVPVTAATHLPESEAGMECVLLRDNAYVATFRFHDAPRPESSSFIRHLGPRHQITRVLLLSGDRDSEVRYLAGQVGIEHLHSGKTPEEKVAIVREESSRAPAMFLGDGINDAPAMQAATVGIAFGPNCDITAEAADAVVLVASLGKVDELIHIGRRMRRIALQSAGGGMLLSAIGMGMAATGYLTPVAGAVAQEVIDALAVLNALRMAVPPQDLQDF